MNIRYFNLRKILRLSLVSSAMLLTATAWATLSITATPAGAHFDITGVCTVNGGKVVLEVKPIALTPSNYSGPKKYQLTHLQGQSGSVIIVTGPSTTTSGSCGVAGLGKMWKMKKSEWAPGLWEIKAHQGGNQSAVVQVNM